MDVLVFIGLAIAMVLGFVGFFGRCRACGSWAHAFNPGMPRVSLTARRILCVSAVVIDSIRERCCQTGRLYGCAVAVVSSMRTGPTQVTQAPSLTVVEMVAEQGLSDEPD